VLVLSQPLIKHHQVFALMRDLLLTNHLFLSLTSRIA